MPEFREKFIMWVNGLIIFTIAAFTIFVEILSCPLLFFWFEFIYDICYLVWFYVFKINAV